MKILNGDDINVLLETLNGDDNIIDPISNNNIKYIDFNNLNRHIYGRYSTVENLIDIFTLNLTNKLIALYNSNYECNPISIDCSSINQINYMIKNSKADSKFFNFNIDEIFQIILEIDSFENFKKNMKLKEFFDEYIINFLKNNIIDTLINSSIKASKFIKNKNKKLTANQIFSNILLPNNKTFKNSENVLILCFIIENDNFKEELSLKFIIPLKYVQFLVDLHSSSPLYNNINHKCSGTILKNNNKLLNKIENSQIKCKICANKKIFENELKINNIITFDSKSDNNVFWNTTSFQNTYSNDFDLRTEDNFIIFNNFKIKKGNKNA